jgi:hypothetical protein
VDVPIPDRMAYIWCYDGAPKDSNDGGRIS